MCSWSMAACRLPLLVALATPFAATALHLPPLETRCDAPCRRHLLQAAAAAPFFLSGPRPASAAAAAGGPRWRESPGVLPTAMQDPGNYFLDLEDGFEIAYPVGSSWMRTQPLPELLGGAPSRGTRFAATDLGQSAVIAVTCLPRDAAPFWPDVAAARDCDVASGKSRACGAREPSDATSDATAFAQRLLEQRREELAWSSCRLSSSQAVAPDRVEFVGRAYFEVPNDVPIVRKEMGVSLIKPDKVITAWASAPVDTLQTNAEVAKLLPAIIKTFRPTRA